MAGPDVSVPTTMSAPSGADAAAGRPLAGLRPGTRGRIVRISASAGEAVVRRLHDLGFTPGAVVEVVRRAPLGDPVAYRVKDYDVCLRAAQARHVEIGVDLPVTA